MELIQLIQQRKLKTRLMKILGFTIALFFGMTVFAQTDGDLPYHQIPEYPETYTAGSVVARMIDGLGFRYYWATEGLREDDLKYKPSEESRTSEQTIKHIYDLSEIILNTAEQKVTDFTIEEESLSYSEMRKKTLVNLKKASEIYRGLVNFENNKMIFKGESGTRKYPFWNNINGPISDAIWHCGQIVSFRRASGNPFSSKVSVLTGKIRQ